MPKWKAAAKGKLKTVAYDTLPFELQLVDQGYVSTLLGQKYFGWGQETVTLMYDHLKNGTEIEPFIDSGFDLVCAANSKEMMDKWRARDFSSALAVECEL
jgi:ribose transport system substrate-binding protein